MDVFAIEKGKALKLSVDEFEKQTCHDYPYYRTNKDKRLSLYAICPECGNPIQIVNMYGEELMLCLRIILLFIRTGLIKDFR